MLWDVIKCCFLVEFTVLWTQWLINCKVSPGKFEEKQVHVGAGNTFHYPQTQFSHIEINFLSGFVQLTPIWDHKMSTKSRIRRGDLAQVLTQAHLHSWVQLKTLLSRPDKTCIYELTHRWCSVIVIWNYFRYLSVYNGEAGAAAPFNTGPGFRCHVPLKILLSMQNCNLKWNNWQPFTFTQRVIITVPTPRILPLSRLNDDNFSPFHMKHPGTIYH